MIESATAIEIVKREVGEDLAFDIAQEQDRQEYRDGRDRRCDQRRHDLLRTFARRFERRHAGFFEPDDVAGYDDRSFDHHTDRERETGQRDDVEAAPTHVERTERRQQANRNRARDQKRCAPVAHEPPDAEKRQQRADDEVFGQEIDRTMDEQRRIEALLDAKPARLQRARAKLVDDLLDLLQRSKNVRARRAQHLQADRRIAVLVDEELLLGRLELDLGDIAELDRPAVAPGKHELAKICEVYSGQ